MPVTKLGRKLELLSSQAEWLLGKAVDLGADNRIMTFGPDVFKPGDPEYPIISAILFECEDQMQILFDQTVQKLLQEFPRR